jgi:hypothetical protein
MNSSQRQGCWLQRVGLAGWVASHPAPPREPAVYPVSDGQSWREHCDSGTDADDW